VVERVSAGRDADTRVATAVRVSGIAGVRYRPTWSAIAGGVGVAVAGTRTAVGVRLCVRVGHLPGGALLDLTEAVAEID